LKFNKIALTLICGLVLSLLWINSAIVGNVYAQAPVVQNSKTLAIKIITPAKNQSVPAGSNLDMSGTSSDDSASDCFVGVIVNSKKPYQNASATGPGGANDYSKWNYKLTSKYTVINEGQNKITAKLTCNAQPDLAPNTSNATSAVKYSSVNVTGTTAGGLPIPQ